jgi:hypothetical protein
MVLAVRFEMYLIAYFGGSPQVAPLQGSSIDEEKSCVLASRGFGSRKLDALFRLVENMD